MPAAKSTGVALLATVLGFGCSGGASAQTTPTLSFTPPPLIGHIKLGLSGGYLAGGGAELFVQASDLVGSFGARFSFSRSRHAGGFDDAASLDGGPDSIASQKNRGEIAGDQVTLQTLGLDASYSLGQPVPGLETSVYAGLRYGQFYSRLAYTNGQSTEYSSSAFGIGLGSQAAYLLTNLFSFFGALGVDQFFGPSAITSRDGQNNCATLRPGDAGYEALNRAVKRPSTVLKATLGVKYSF